MTGPVSADIQPNGDIVYSHGYTSRKIGGGGGGGSLVIQSQSSFDHVWNGE